MSICERNAGFSRNEEHSPPRPSNAHAVGRLDKQEDLWRDKRLTDFAVSAEGVEFKAHRVTLASSSKYFLNLFESGMRDAADATHALEGIRPKALWVASSTSSAGSASTGISARRRSMTLRRTAGRKSPNCSHFVAADL